MKKYVLIKTIFSLLLAIVGTGCDESDFSGFKNPEKIEGFYWMQNDSFICEVDEGYFLEHEYDVTLSDSTIVFENSGYETWTGTINPDDSFFIEDSDVSCDGAFFYNAGEQKVQINIVCTKGKQTCEAIFDRLGVLNPTKEMEKKLGEGHSFDPNCGTILDFFDYCEERNQDEKYECENYLEPTQLTCDFDDDHFSGIYKKCWVEFSSGEELYFEGDLWNVHSYPNRISLSLLDENSDNFPPRDGVRYYDFYFNEAEQICLDEL